MPTPSNDRASAENPSQGTRLDSWKEIAAYLCRGERTVKRWETDRGLPVHRLPGGGRASVYAYSNELDVWLKSSEEPEPFSAPENTGEEALQNEVEESSATSSQSPPDLYAGPLPPRSLPSKPRLNRKWLLVFACVVAIAVTGAAMEVRALRNGDHPVSGAVLSLFSKSQPKSDLKPSFAISSTEKSVARDLYLKGRFEWNKRTPESLNRALDDFTQSIVHDPSSAPTYAGLADTYILLREYSLMPSAEAYSRAIAASSKAVELDDSLAEAHRSLAFAEVWGKWDFQLGEKEFRRAIQLDPRDPLAHLWYATAFKAPEWQTITRREFDRAQELDPSSAIVLANKSIWLFETGQRRAGLELAQQVERDDPDFVAPHRYLAGMYWSLRQYPEFLAESEKAADLRHDPILKQITAAVRAGFRRDGEGGLLSELYLARKKQFLAGKFSGSFVAEVCIRLGKNDEAVQLIQDDFDHHRAEFLEVLTNPELNPLKADQRYRALIDKLNFPKPPLLE